MIGNVYTVVENVPPGGYIVYDRDSEANGVQGGQIYVPFKGLALLSEDELVTFTVSGKIGIKYDLDTGCISDVKPAGHAKTLGIQVGWIIHRLDNAPYSDALLRKKSFRGSSIQDDIAEGGSAGNIITLQEDPKGK